MKRYAVRDLSKERDVSTFEQTQRDTEQEESDDERSPLAVGD